MSSCRSYINQLSKDEKVQDKLTEYHNLLFKRLIDSKLFNKYNDHYFLPPVGSGRYTKAQSLIAELNKEYSTPVVGTAFTKANSKEYVFVNVKNLLSRAQDEVVPQEITIQGKLFQKEELTSSKASPKTIGKVKEWLSRIGVDIKSLDSKRYGGVNGIANLLKATIEIAEGKESTTLPEEAMHFAVDILKTSNPALYRAMFNKIGQFNIYTLTRNSYESSSEYKNPDGSPNIPKIKEEAIGKLLAEYYIKKEEFGTEKPEFLLQTKTWWEQFVEWIKSLLGVANFNPFEEAVNTLPENNKTNEGRIKELAELIQIQDVPSYMRKSIDQAFEAGEYREIVNTIAEQLADTPTYETTKDLYLGGNEVLAQEILSVYQQFLQISGEESPKNEFADSLIKKLEDKIEQFKLVKVEDEEAADEDDRNYYKATIGGKEVRTDRTTDYAKRANIKYTGGKDFFADLDEAKAKYYTLQAMEGTKGHFDIERIIQSALNPDGTLKPKGTFTPNITPTVNKDVFKVLQNFLLGTDQTPGFLYQFAEGTKFLIEQRVLNDKAKARVDDKELIGRAGTMDLMVIEPASEAHPKGQVTIYDWKFMGMNDKAPEYKHAKRSQHQLQLADYKRTLKEGYGLKEDQIKAYTIPISAKYTETENKKTKEKIPNLVSVKIGNVDIKTEDRPWLLPVVPDDQSTGNKELDRLIFALNAEYKKMYKKKVPGKEWSDKIEDLNEMSSAIRNLHVAINFEPLSIEALTFQKNVQKVLDKYSSLDTKGMSKEQLDPIFTELADAIKISKFYADIDSVFISEYGRTDLSEKNQSILDSLQATSATAKDSVKKLQKINNDIIAQKAREDGAGEILTPEKEAKGTINQLLESGSQPLKSLNYLTATSIAARSADVIEVSKLIEEFTSLYTPLQKLSESKGMSPFALIADPTDHHLIRRVDKDVYDYIKKAKNNRDKKALLSKIDIEKYNTLAQARIKERSAEFDERPWDDKKKKQEKQRLIRTLDINDKDFDGWKHPTVGAFIRKSLKEEENYSKEYKLLLDNPEYKSALDMYNFITGLNKQAKEVGYLGRNQGELFLAFVNATMAQRVIGSSNKWKTFSDSFLDMFTVQEYEEQMYGKKDEETGELDRSIPTYFTRELDKDKRSTDLFAIIPLYIKALVHFQTSQKLESLFQSVVSMEKESKGHLVSVGGKMEFQGDSPKVYTGNDINAQKIQEYRDDQIYGIQIMTDDLIARGISNEGRALSARKTTQVLNRWTQQLAVGLKALVAVPNYIGAGMQAVINAGRFYQGREYTLNHTKIIGSKIALSDLDKALIDLAIPLNEDSIKGQLRQAAWRQSPLKWLSTISFQDFMMSFNRLGDVSHQLTNALTWMDNTMVVDGKFVNIRQHLRQKPEYSSRYSSPATLKDEESKFHKEVEELKKTHSLRKIAKFNSEGFLTIPGIADISTSNLAEYRAKIIEYGRNITSQMSKENEIEAQRNIIAKSFMMFKTWIVKQSEIRFLDIKKNQTLDEWEYGRTRLFFKTWSWRAGLNIKRMSDIINATPKGIEIMRKMYEEKIEEYYKKTGQELDISEAEFFDMVRKELRSEVKELATLFSIMAAVFAIKAAAPPEDEEDDAIKNKWKLFARTLNKASDELLFYYSPLSAESITRGTIIPSLGLLSKATRLVEQTGKEIFGDEEKREQAHPLKALFNLTPVAAQFQTELAPIIFPEWTKEQGIRLSEEARAFR